MLYRQFWMKNYRCELSTKNDSRSIQGWTTNDGREGDILKKTHKTLLNLQFYPTSASLIWYNECFIVCRPLDTSLYIKHYICVLTVSSQCGVLSVVSPNSYSYWVGISMGYNNKKGTTAIISTLNMFYKIKI